MSAPLRGIVAYPITPFTSSGRIDEALLGRIVDDMVGAGVHAIAPLGSTGVLPYLTDEEREQVAEVVVQRVAGRVPTLVGVSSLTTARTVHHAKHAERMVKESTGDVQRMHRLVQLCGGDVSFYNGSNPLALAAFVAGARGWCTAAPHVIPRLNVELYEAIQRGDLATARRSFYRQLPFLQFIVAHGLPRTISASLELMGTRVGPLRAPLRPLPPERVAELRQILLTLEVLPPAP